MNRFSDINILDCFEFKCPLKWANLDRTENKDIRNCNECKKEVSFAYTVKQAEQIACDNKCVAMLSRKPRQYGYEEEAIVMLGVLSTKRIKKKGG